LEEYITGGRPKEPDPPKNDNDFWMGCTVFLLSVTALVLLSVAVYNIY